MKRWLREPLLHFVLLGGLLFAGYGLVRRETRSDPERIVVGPGQIEHLIATFVRTWQRPPAPEEVKGLIDQYVREEVLSREAMKLGLDRNDVIIRRRLQQKMEFIADDLAALAEPTDADLGGYLTAHPDAFRQDQRFTFRHVYLSPEKHGERLDGEAAKLLAELGTLGAAADVSTLGDATLLDPAFRDEPRHRVEAGFGAEFAARLVTLPVGRWSGPLTSAFGTHLVFVEERTEGRLPALDEVRSEVRREWENARRLEANRRFLEGLMKRYEVSVEWPQAQAGGASAR